MANNRMITVENADVQWSVHFDSTLKKDSEALHEILCEIDPGAEYTVSFCDLSQEMQELIELLAPINRN